MTGSAGAVLRKKLGAFQARGYSLPIQRELAAALEYGAAKGAGAALKVVAEAIVAQSRIGRLDAMIGALPAPGLLSLLAFEGGSAVIGFDISLVDNVVDILAGGSANGPCKPSGAGAERAPTAIDAMLCRRVAAAIMDHFDARLQTMTGGAGIGRCRHGRTVPDALGLRFVLPDEPYLIFQVTLDIGDDARGGAFHIALPLAVIEPVEAVLRRTGLTSAHIESNDWSRHMRMVVRRTRIRVDAVIERGQIAVAELARLEVGGIFPLAEVTLDDVTLEMTVGSSARAVGRGRLGAYRRNKAVRLTESLDRALLEPLVDLLAVGVDEVPPVDDDDAD